MESGFHYIEKVRLNKLPPRDSYLSELPTVKNLAAMDELNFEDVTFIVGENGSGKSTLLEAIAVAAGFNPEGGTKNFNFGTYDSHSELSEHITLSKGPYRPKDGFFLRAESFYNVASYIEKIDKLPAAAPRVIEGYGGKSLHEQSHGESFLAVIKNRFFGNGLYILDEPEAALSPTGIMSLMVVMHDLIGKNSQFIISTHSPILMTYPDALLYELGEMEIRRISYRETSHYMITKHFLNDPEKMLGQLLE